MKMFFKVSAITCAVLLSACGGGGSGSSGEQINAPYSITLRTSKSQLPLNIAGQPAGIGAYAPYTATMYVEARAGSALVSGGKEIFGCNVVEGLDSGVLYYLDGDTKHEDEDGNPLAYRAVTLDSNSGGASFHFHAGSRAGTARIVCSITNPADKKVYSASTQIIVGAATGQPASIRTTAQAPGYLGTTDNINGLRNNVGMQAFAMDDANQPIPNPGAANMQVSIRPSVTSKDARLLSGSQSGKVLQVRTIGGIGQFSLSSGNETGSIILELVTDRFDNNVSNGIQDPVTSLTAVSVHKALASIALAITADTEITVNNAVQFITALSAEGGVPPYTWSSSGLPNGLRLDETGVISGTPRVAPGTYNTIVRVTDGIQAVVTKNIQVKVEGALVENLVFNINGCTGSANDKCVLPSAAEGKSYAYSFSATGGDATLPIEWKYSGLPKWLEGSAAGNNGVITGTPKIAVAPEAPSTPSTPSTPGTPGTPGDAGTYEFFVTAVQNAQSVTRKISIEVK